MKHIKKLLLLASAVLMSISFCYANANTDDETPKNYKPIVVRRDPTNFHRSLEAPIFAYYAAGTINLDFVENLGTATVAVQNLTVGGQVVELIDSGMGTATIDVNSILTVGNYYMTITTMSGDVYYAEFTLE